jgi:hypothetical protein
MDITATSKPEKSKERKYQSFPLLPVLDKRKGDKHNTPGFSFSWLFIKIWSLDAFQFELAFTIDTHWGIGITALLPYLRVVICIPCPMKVQMWAQKHLWRHPKK